MSLRKYISRRIALMIFVLWGITTVTFLIMNVIPRNPALAMVGNNATYEQIVAFNERWGFDRPLGERYIKFYFHLLRGDLGISIRTERPMVAEIATHFPATFELAFVSLLISIILGIPLGVYSAIKRNRWFDHVVRFFSMVGVSTPNFWLGLMLLFVFYYNLRIFEPGRASIYVSAPVKTTGLYILDSILSREWDILLDSLRHIFLPALTLGLCCTGYVARLTRASMFEVLSSDYIQAARSRGLSQRVVVFKHALRNALIPTISILGILTGNMLAGSIIVETVFSWPGLGYFAYQSILKGDQPAVLAVTLIIAVFYSVVNFLVDIIYRIVDPRINVG